MFWGVLWVVREYPQSCAFTPSWQVNSIFIFAHARLNGALSHMNQLSTNRWSSRLWSSLVRLVR